ncbi:MAG: ABC transporter permease [Candidatus Bipolaricaulota bacterium]
MTAFRALLRAEAAVLRRDRASLVFTFLFPLLFILIFGAMMSSVGSTESTRLGVVVLDGADRDVLDRVFAGSVAEIRHLASRAELEAAIDRRDVDFGAIWDGVTLGFAFDVRRTQDNFVFDELADGLAAQMDLALQGRSPLLASTVRIAGGEPDASWLTLVVPGILAFSVLSAGLFAIAGHLTSMKQRRLLDRFVVTPMRPTTLLAAIVVVRLVVVAVSTLMTLAVATTLFRIRYDVSWVRYVAFLISATLGTMGMGAVFTLLVRQPSSAGNLANIVSILMMFTSGIYFPVEIMPPFLRGLSRAMPLTYMADAMRYATGVMDMQDSDFWLICGAFLLLGLALLPGLARYIVRPLRR